ncbi:hypothetical protein R84981_002848 [Carnimonas sp. R-84981]|uniref:hypothetical protein n=1 Tax=Carnimonas bestiolae TaxID=3402172 RepID=UPI003EDC2067
MSELREAVEGRIFDILTPDFFIAAMQSGQGPEPDETLGGWVVKVHKDAAEAVADCASDDVEVEEVPPHVGTQLPFIDHLSISACRRNDVGLLRGEKFRKELEDYMNANNCNRVKHKGHSYWRVHGQFIIREF